MARITQAAGVNQPFVDVFPTPIVSRRDPTFGDKTFDLGQRWINKSTNELYTLVAINSGRANWKLLSQDVFTLNIQTFTSSGTYTPTTGMQYCHIECLAGGGAGGGAGATAVGETSIGGGGGTGSYGVGVFSAAQIGASQTITVGAGGTGSAANPGNPGGASSVGSLLTTGGGIGGAEATGSGTLYVNGSQGGFAGSGGSINIPGWRGLVGISNADLLIPGEGGNTPYGIGGHVAHGISADGLAGLGFGSGGGGGGNSASQVTERSGGDGAGGIVIITEYILA